MKNYMADIRLALENSEIEVVRPNGPTATKETREGWLSPAYDDSRRVEINYQTAEANRCLCLLSDNDALEYYKVLRAQIQQRMVQNNWNTIMITSPQASEGKTLTAVNLALTMAKEFSQTLMLVDADLKYQNVHKYLGYTHSLGLADFLDGGMPLKEVIVWPGVEKLTVISGGKTLQGSTELLTSPKMKSLVAEMKTRYDDRYVLFDVPPVLNSSDAISFAHLVDAILLVVSEGRTTTADVQKAVSLLPAEKILGIALNKHQFDIKTKQRDDGMMSKIKGLFGFLNKKLT